jgi:hypothetical protein
MLHLSVCTYVPSIFKDGLGQKERATKKNLLKARQRGVSQRFEDEGVSYGQVDPAIGCPDLVLGPILRNPFLPKFTCG